MSDAPELEELFAPIRQAMADMEARALRFGHIESTIRVNAMRHGATNAQIDDFIAGRADFIGWLAEKVERRTTDPRVAALVEAAEALGVRKLVAGWNGEDRETPYTPHPPHLWAKINTTCGAVYALDAALAAFRGDADE